MTDTFLVQPIHRPLDAVVDDIPGSKSIANRALICAALAPGTSTLHRLAPGDDTAAMLDCLTLLGVDIDRDIDRDIGSGSIDGGTAVDAATVRIAGLDGRIDAAPATLYTRLAGTTSRFITALAALGTGPFCIDGAPPLRARPMSPLHDALQALGVTITPGDRWGHLPVDISGGQVAGGSVTMPGDISSQYMTALMLIAPYFPAGLSIELSTELVSRPYVELTAAVMASFGVDSVEIEQRHIAVHSGRYVATDYGIEVDASSASYAFAAAAIAGGTVTVAGLGSASLQGDRRFADVLASMGATVEMSAEATTVTVATPLRGVEIDMADISDTTPSLAVVAAFADGPTTIRGVEFIRRKETDRIDALVTELRRCGADIDEYADGLTLRPRPLHGATIDTYHDHRIAMAMALVGLQIPGVRINDPVVVSKSWPQYWSFLTGLQPGDVAR